VAASEGKGNACVLGLPPLRASFLKSEGKACGFGGGKKGVKRSIAMREAGEGECQGKGAGDKVNR